MPACSIATDVPQDTGVKVMVVTIWPGRLGSSKRSSCRMRSLGSSSKYVPPNEWLCPFEKLVNDMRYWPPTRASMACTRPVNPKGGIHLQTASGSKKARYRRSAGARITRCRVTVPVVMVGLSGQVTVVCQKPRQGLGQVPGQLGILALLAAKFQLDGIDAIRVVAAIAVHGVPTGVPR